MERLHGVPLTDLAAIRSMTSADPEQTLITALNTWFGSVLGCETFHADVHAGARPAPTFVDTAIHACMFAHIYVCSNTYMLAHPQRGTCVLCTAVQMSASHCGGPISLILCRHADALFSCEGCMSPVINAIGISSYCCFARPSQTPQCHLLHIGLQLELGSHLSLHLRR